MTKNAILPKIDKLTPEMLEEVNKFLDYILFINSNNNIENIERKRNGFGIAKGKISISDDFNEPIVDLFEVLK
jgi:hypothetical protein